MNTKTVLKVGPYSGTQIRIGVMGSVGGAGGVIGGSMPRFETSRLARFFTKRQQIRMPAYHSPNEQVDDIVAYIQWMSKEETR